MGTNYYQVIDCCDKCGRGVEQIHIGKSSGGWPFIVHIIPEMGINNWHDWCARLENGAEIKDEYGKKISLLELHELIKNKRIHANEPYVLMALNDYPHIYKQCPNTGDTLSTGEFS